MHRASPLSEFFNIIYFRVIKLTGRICSGNKLGHSSQVSSSEESIKHSTVQRPNSLGNDLVIKYL